MIDANDVRMTTNNVSQAGENRTSNQNTTRDIASFPCRHHPSQFQLLGEGGGSLHGGCMTPPHMEKEEKKCKKPHIKKPLNAFMLFMKEMRAKVIEECTLKESAAINQILGRKVRVVLHWYRRPGQFIGFLI